MILILAVVSLVVGILIGTVGVGGILLIPALEVFAGLNTHASMSTALFSFIFTGIIGTYLYQKYGSIDWRITIPVCIGGIIFGYIGAFVNAHINANFLKTALSSIIVFSGIYTLKHPKQLEMFKFNSSNKIHLVLLIGIGSVVGFGSGLTGVGGPVLSVPLMVISGFAPLTAIATSQVIQIAAAISGTIGNFTYGSINFSIGFWITLLELFGVILGARVAHAAKKHQLRIFVAIICIMVGSMLFIRTVCF